MKTLLTIILLATLSACSNQAPPPAAQNKEAIFVLVENGGTIPANDQGDALDTVFHLLEQITKLDRRKATRDAQIYILLSASPNRITWSGNPHQLLKQAANIKDLISFKNSFSDLVMAFDQIETTINLTQPDNVRLYWIGSTIHVPFQSSANNTPIEVRVPQEVPKNLALINFLDRISTLKIMRVHPDQDPMMLDFLGASGVLTKAKSGEIDFALLGAAQTKSRLKKLL